MEVTTYRWSSDVEGRGLYPGDEGEGRGEMGWVWFGSQREGEVRSWAAREERVCSMSAMCEQESRAQP